MTTIALLVASLTFFLSFLDIACLASFASDSAMVHGNGWGWQNPLPQGDSLLGVWGISSSDVFAVGERGTILHYDGATWDRMSSEATYSLCAVWGSSSSDIFSVGAYGTIVHFDGTKWSPMTSNSLIGVTGIWGSSPDSVFAVSGGSFLHYDGNAWSYMISETGDWPGAVWGTSDTDVFAVGTKGCVNRYDGSKWNQMESGTGNWLQGVWGTTQSDVFAVGSSGTIVHFDGNAWSSMSSGTTEALMGVWGSSSSDVLVVGGRGTILHYNGSAWSAMSSGTRMDLVGIWGTSPSCVFAVGATGTILHWDGIAWNSMSSAVGNNGRESAGPVLHGVWSASQSEIYAVGDEGTILYSDGASWNQDNPTGRVLTDVWGSSASNVFAIGWDPLYLVESVVLHGSANNWVAMPHSAGAQYLAGIWGSSGADVFIVGDGILHFDGSSWTDMYCPTSQMLEDVWGSSSSDVFAVGRHGVIVHYDGTTWSLMDCQYINDLRGVWGTSSSDVYAVGDFGTILHYDGETWGLMKSGTEMRLCAVWGSSASDVFVGGGCILHSNGSEWSAMNDRGATIYDIFGNSSSDVYAVGADLAILHLPEVDMPPVVQEILPSQGVQGGSIAVTITGANLDEPAEPHFGSGITVRSSVVDSDNQITVDITIQSAAQIGTRDVWVNTLGGVGFRVGAFTVLPGVPNQFPIMPINASPRSGAKGIRRMPLLQASVFSDPDSGNVHAASQWQITTMPGDYTSPVYDSGIDPSNLISITIPSNLLSYSTTYFWHVRYQDNHGDWSDWSIETPFTTAASAKAPQWIWIIVGVAAALTIGLGAYLVRKRRLAEP